MGVDLTIIREKDAVISVVNAEGVTEQKPWIDYIIGRFGTSDEIDELWKQAMVAFLNNSVYTNAYGVPDVADS